MDGRGRTDADGGPAVIFHPGQRRRRRRRLLGARLLFLLPPPARPLARCGREGRKPLNQP